jgi:cytochrome P450
VLLIAAANRDAEAFADPERYDLGRDTRRAISFGGGPHFCLGAPLARLEARIVLEELVARVGDYEIDEDRASRVRTTNIRGFDRLPTTVKLR